MAAGLVEPALRTIARRYVAGPSFRHATEAAGRFAADGMSATVGFWDDPGSSPQEVADEYTGALAALGNTDTDDVLAVKLPAIGMSPKLLDEVARHAVAARRRLHVDALAPEAADETFRLVAAVREIHPQLRIGVTLPGRWARSPLDAADVRRQRLPVRVVKGEWPDPGAPDRDPRDGFLEVIDALAGTEGHVGVATHDPELAAESVRRLRAAGTPCTVELLLGLPMRASLQQARRLGVPVRVYVPYGHAYMPYALAHVRREPRIALWIARDMAGTALDSLRRARSRHPLASHPPPRPEEAVKAIDGTGSPRRAERR
jgi:proline dehydrogenase